MDPAPLEACLRREFDEMCCLLFGRCCAQHSGEGAERWQGRTFSAAQIREQLTALAPKAAAAGSAGQVLADYGSHRVQISVRTTSAALKSTRTSMT